MAKGRVCTGYSCPWVAEYTEQSGTVTYDNAMRLARGVSVKLDVQAADDSKFYADDVAAESSSGKFGSGTATLVNDGLKDTAAKMIYGLPTADSSGWTHYGDEMEIPYVGIGYIKQYMEDGVTSWVPVVLRKAKFVMFGDDAKTMEENIDWQTQELTANLHRDDTTTHDWRWIGVECTSKAAAEAKIKTMFGVTQTT